MFFFLKKYLCFLQNIHYLQKNVFIWKKTFFTEKNINENVKIYISSQKYIFTDKMFVLQIKHKSFLNTYSFCKKKIFLIIKNVFVKTSL